MQIADLNGKNVCILGFGKEGQAILKAIETYAPGAEVTVADQNELTVIPKPHWQQVGSGYLKNLEKFDTVIKSPGIPPSPELASVGGKLTTPTQFFLEAALKEGALVIGVTGSKGKSTTSSLIAAMLMASGKDVSLIGNIGEPAIAHIAEINPKKIFVFELSSYQLLDLTISPTVAVVTSFFPDHLDYHGSLKAYREAKSHIATFQKPKDVIFYAKNSEGAKWIAEHSAGKHVPFSAEESPVQIDETRLIGLHNQSNIAGAYMAAMHAGADSAKAIEAIKNFQGLPHRLQSLGVHHGIEWIDDAISTTPESTIAALDALGDRVATIILGGQDRGYDFGALARRLKQSQVKTAILFPGSGPKIRDAIGDAQVDICMKEAESMEKAVTAARKNTMEGKICLLSTASPSYGMFKNFEEKGDQFKAAILEK